MKPLSRIVPPSVTMSLDQEARKLSSLGQNVINLTAGQVDLPMPAEGKQAVLAALEADQTGYVPAVGSADLKQAVRESKGWSAGSILISAGAKPLLNAAVACVCGHGDEVLLPVPCYTSYPEMIRLAGGLPVAVPCSAQNGFVPTAEAMDRFVSSRTKALLLNHPTNPTGAVYPEGALKEIVDFCAAHDLWLIADEVYGAFVYEEAFVSLYDFPKVRERLILVDSTSKTYAMAGLRLGYAVAPEPAAAAMTGYLSHALGCPCSLSERAAKAVLTLNGEYAAALREVFRKRRDLMLSEIETIPGIRTAGSKGALYLWLDISDVEADDVLFCRRLLSEEGVAVTPGSAFLSPGYVRIAYTGPEPDLLEAAEKLRRFVNRSIRPTANSFSSRPNP